MIYENVNGTDFHQIPFAIAANQVPIEINEGAIYLKQYYSGDIISDELIEEVLATDLSHVDLYSSWFMQNDASHKFHAERIAKIVLFLKENKGLDPVTLNLNGDGFYIKDGYHRIRALTYLGYTHYPATIGGRYAKNLIQCLKKFNSTT